MEQPLTAGEIKRGLKTSAIGHNIVCVREVSSTMELARKLAEKGTAEGTIVVADRQSGGRGRFQRGWISPPGVNLYFSLVLRPKIQTIHFINMIGSLSIVRAIRSVTGLSAVIKWPNDVKINNHKICGILVESRFSGGGLLYFVLGVGVNVNFDPTSYPEIAATATSLKLELGKQVNRLTLLKSFLNEFDKLYRTFGDGREVQKEWRSLLETLGLRIQVRQMNRFEQGTAIDIDEDGNLLLRRDDNSTVLLYAGEVTSQI